jgi:glycosyltransferase involved in cell wall biosynthesis
VTGVGRSLLEVEGAPTAKSEDALAARLRAIAPLLLDAPLPDADRDPASDAANTLDLLVEFVAAKPSSSRIWLLLTSLCAAYPTRTEIDRIRRLFELLDHRNAVISLLDISLSVASARGEPETDIHIIEGGVIVDVDHSAKFDLNTGIQRVTRCLLPIWNDQHEIVPAAWTANAGALRSLTPMELERVVSWSSRKPATRADDHNSSRTAPRLLVPWRSVVVMAEVPPGNVSDSLAAIGDYSGSRLVGIAYDSIPVVSADMVPAADTSKFVRYLTCLKFASRMAGISSSSASEIAGFVQALSTQGLPGPVVVEVPLASPAADFSNVRTPDTNVPNVLVIGSHEPRKNHLAILHGAEILWREGAKFSLSFIGGSGWGDEFPRRAAELVRADRPITVRRAVSESELEASYATASFTVFPSLHEGYGLPVAESLAHGVPVITSDFGSTAEIGAHGGALLVNPHDDDALTSAMRTLLSDGQTQRRLRQEIRSRPERTWQNYSDELWELLIEPELEMLKGDIDGVNKVDR